LAQNVSSKSSQQPFVQIQSQGYVPGQMTVSGHGSQLHLGGQVLHQGDLVSRHAQLQFQQQPPKQSLPPHAQQQHELYHHQQLQQQQQHQMIREQMFHQQMFQQHVC
jgi:hypothetical protein